jgi:hypothetical protein
MLEIELELIIRFIKINKIKIPAQVKIFLVFIAHVKLVVIKIFIGLEPIT